MCAPAEKAEEKGGNVILFEDKQRFIHPFIIIFSKEERLKMVLHRIKARNSSGKKNDFKGKHLDRATHQLTSSHMNF